MAKYEAQEAVRIESLILAVRGLRVMLDSDLAKVYGVTTARLNEQFKRNSNRFPSDFAFQITPAELEVLMSQFATSKKGPGGRRKLPRVFTEHGALMLASVLNSPVAIEASIRVVRAFVLMREQLAAHKELSLKLKELESRVSGHDEAITNIFEAIRQLVEPALPENRRQIGFMRESEVQYRIRKNSRN
jgi:hypothetical protein